MDVRKKCHPKMNISDLVLYVLICLGATVSNVLSMRTVNTFSNCVFLHVFVSADCLTEIVKSP